MLTKVLDNLFGPFWKEVEKSLLDSFILETGFQVRITWAYDLGVPVLPSCTPPSPSPLPPARLRPCARPHPLSTLYASSTPAMPTRVCAHDAATYLTPRHCLPPCVLRVPACCLPACL